MRLLTASQASTAAYGWGETNTHYPTNRRGAHFLSCSGHGGFVIDDLAFTGDERARLYAAGFKPDGVDVVVDTDSRTIRRVRGLDSFRTLRYFSGRQEVRSDRVWLFEEDCEWAAVIVLTGIRVPAAFGAETEDELQDAARSTLGRWYPDALVEKAVAA